jgi:cytochrome oxidase Cu insertion factor (SCO1/SenC/PrrC family)/Cu/Ag efflux protein CusF
MRRVFTPAFAFAFAFALAALSGAPALARDRLTGIVLMNPAGNMVLVHHEPFAGMPAMTMSFRVPPGTVLHPGEHIAAEVDRAGDPWSLSAIRVTAAATAQHLHLPHFVNVGDAVPDLAFVDQGGRRMTLAALRGSPYALTFMYTRCRDPRMCPFVSAKMHMVQSRTAGSPVQLVEVSLDPVYDRPAVLARYGTTFGADPARWHLLTGDPKPVLDFAARFRILERSAGPTTIIHSERLAIVDARGRIIRLIDNETWKADDVANELKAAI